MSHRQPKFSKPCSFHPLGRSRRILYMAYQTQTRTGPETNDCAGLLRRHWPIYLEPTSLDRGPTRNCMTSSVAEVETCRVFDFIVAGFTRPDPTVPNNIVVCYAKWNSLALITPSRATGEQYTRVLYTLTVANPDA